jgi:hypothetical protein
MLTLLSPGRVSSGCSQSAPLEPAVREQRLLSCSVLEAGHVVLVHARSPLLDCFTQEDVRARW